MGYNKSSSPCALHYWLLSEALTGVLEKERTYANGGDFGYGSIIARSEMTTALSKPCKTYITIKKVDNNDSFDKTFFWPGFSKFEEVCNPSRTRQRAMESLRVI